MQHAVKASSMARGSFQGRANGHHHHRRGMNREVGSHNNVMDAMHLRPPGAALDPEANKMVAKLTLKMDRLEAKMTHDMDQLKSEVAKILAALAPDERCDSSATIRRVSRNSGEGQGSKSQSQSQSPVALESSRRDTPRASPIELADAKLSDRKPRSKSRSPENGPSPSNADRDPSPVTRRVPSPVMLHRRVSDESPKYAGVQEI